MTTIDQLTEDETMQLDALYFAYVRATQLARELAVMIAYRLGTGVCMMCLVNAITTLQAKQAMNDDTVLATYQQLHDHT